MCVVGVRTTYTQFSRDIVVSKSKICPGVDIVLMFNAAT